MQKLVGIYPLTYVGGFAGANSMFDTWIENGKWISSSSEIVEGMRDGGYNDLSEEDIDFLNSTYIKIDSSLALFVVFGNKEVLKSEYRPNGMDYRITDTTEASIIDFLKDDKLGGVNSSTIFYHDKTILLVADQKIDWEDKFNTSFYSVLFDHLLLTYDLKDTSFNIQIFEGQCCSSGSMLFKK